MNDKEFYKNILNKTKISYKALLDDRDKIVKNIANKGLKVDQIAVRYGAEYNGFSIKALEHIKPLLTDLRVAKAVKFLNQGNIQKAAATLHLTNEINKEGL